MRIFAVILISLLAICLATCRKAEHPQNAGAVNNPPRNAADSPDLNPILEISEDAEGMFSVTGKSLFFRLYSDGTAEFEFQDEAKKESGKTSYQAEKINTLKRIKLNSEETEKFKDLLVPANFAAVNGDYKPRCCCTDTSLSYRIMINTDAQKVIDLRNFCDLSMIKDPHIQDLAGIPTKISALITLIDITRLKYEN